MSLSQELPSPRRIASIDAFRGLTILAMVFVNDLAHFPDVPLWLKHMPEKADGMTFADIVFPAFLFIVGMAIPFAMARRLASGEPVVRQIAHVLLRTFGLLVMGVFMVNMGAYDPDATGMSRRTWTLLVYAGIILVWNRYPNTPTRVFWVFALLRAAGILLLIWLAWSYQGRAGDQAVWLRTQWWGILGLIGWAYLIGCLAWLTFRGAPAAMVGVLALLVALFIGDRSGALANLGRIREFISLGSHIGGHGALVVSGILAASIIRSPVGAARQIVRLMLLAAAFAMGGFLLRPLYGINKVAATPTWCLYSAALCCIAYALLYLLIDVIGKGSGARLLRGAGINPLLAFILPTIVYAILGMLGVTWLSEHWNSGTEGLIRSFLFAATICALCGLLYRAHVRLQV